MEIWQFDLTRGHSRDPRNGSCLLDAVSWFEYGTLDDHPPCVSPVYAAFGRGANDLLPYDRRQELKSLILRLLGTVDPAAEQDRAEFLMWQAIRIFAPLALEAAALANPAYAIELRDHAGRLQVQKTANVAARVARAAAKVANAAANATANVDAAAAITAAALAASSAAAAAAFCVAKGTATESAAAAAARATAAAAYAALKADDGSIEDEVYDLVIAAFEGVLKIGKQAPAIDAGVINHANRTFSLAQLSGES